MTAHFMTNRKKITAIQWRIKRELLNNPGNTLSIAITVFFIFAFSFFSILQYFSLGDSAYDLGLHAQIIESFLHGKLFYSPLIGESLLAEHFTIFEFFQVPVYALYQSPLSLLVFQDIFVAAGGYMLYLISKHLLNKHTKSLLSLEIISVSFLLVYEISPYTQSLVSFPFHNMAFLPFFFLLATYSFLTERKLFHFFSLAMIVSLHSNFVYIVAVLLLYEFLFLRTRRGKSIDVWLSSKHNPRGKIQFLYFIIFVVALYAYVVFAGLMKGYISGLGFTTLVPGTGAAGAASDSPVGLIIMFFTNPNRFFSFISPNIDLKIFYLTFIFRNTAFLSFLSPLALIMTLPYLLYAMPSNYPSYYELGYQYGSMLSGPVFFGAIIGVCNIALIAQYLKKKVNSHKKRKEYVSKKTHALVLRQRAKTYEKNYITIIGIILVLISVAIIPYGIFSPGAMFQKPGGSAMQNINYLVAGNSSTFLIRESSLMPSNAYILTENTLMPYFSNHVNTYSTPWSPGIYGNLSKFTYLVFQYNSFWAITTQSRPPLQTIAMDGLSNGTYRIIASCPDSEILVLERTS